MIAHHINEGVSGAMRSGAMLVKYAKMGVFDFLERSPKASSTLKIGSLSHLQATYFNSAKW
jgi:hypothetical protein